MPRERPLLEILEGRTLLSTYTVNALTDSGAGSGLTGDLRYCITNATSGNDTITFGVTGTIQLKSALPALNASVAIQGPGASQVTLERFPGGNSSSFDLLQVGNAATVEISGLTLINHVGYVLDNSGSAILRGCTESGGAGGSYGGIDNFGSATVSDCTFSGNNITAIYNIGSATVSDCTLLDNYGGAIGNNGTLTVNDSTVMNNGSGALSNSGTLIINNSTVADNFLNGGQGAASSGGGILSFAGDGMGAGIYMGAGTLTINSCTLEGNRAAGGSATTLYAQLGYSAGNGLGGGLYIAGGTVSINNSTIADNTASGGSFFSDGTGSGGGIYNAAGPGALQMHDTILADDTADAAPDLDGGFTSLGHNLIGNSSGGSGFAASDLLNVKPQLGPLQNNGGPTQTMALLPGSPAIDAGDNTGAPAYDQRGPGFPRIVNDTIDIGAFEVQGKNSNQASSLSVAGFPSVITAGNAGSFTVTALNADGSTDTGYTGTVHFTSTDSQAILPADYTFTTADAGVHTFSATLKTVGTQSITATDTSSLTGTESGITVNPAAASQFILHAPSSVTAGQSFSLNVTVEDAYGNVVIGYAGTIHFSSTDKRAKLPTNYTFTASDKGVHTFTGLVLYTRGNQKITITDTHNSALTDSAIVDVLSSKKSHSSKVNEGVVTYGPSASSQEETGGWIDWWLATFPDLAAENGVHHRQPR
jgi:hypothetical protein